MRERGSTAPVTFFFLVLPNGISSGFASITLPFILTQAGFSIALTASIVAIGVSANLWRFLWGPVADFSFSARWWYLLGLIISVLTLLLVGLVPLHPNAAGFLTAVVFVSQVASTLIILPLGGMMAYTVPEEAKGRAGGWYQAGNLGGNGIGGGVGVWLAAHVSKEASAGALALMMIVSAAAIYFAGTFRVDRSEGFGERMRSLWHDILAMVRSAIPLFTIVLVCSPVGSGAMNNLWSAVAPDWRANPDTVALVGGVLNGVVSAVGCVAGGWVADRIGRWWAYFGSGAVLAFVTMVMAAAARTPFAYVVGVLAYALFCGMSYAAFSAVILLAMGRGAASTKYATLSSLGNLPVVYMTALDGWVHDRFGTSWMLNAEALAGLVFLVIALLVLQRINAARA